jgi:integrase
MVVFRAATGLRPAELVALEKRDVDRSAGVVYVRRQLVRGQVKPTKTRRSVRAMPLQLVAVEALDELPMARARCCSRHRRAATSTCTTSVPASGDQHSSEQEIGPGHTYVIEPGHDAWVVGDEPVVGFEFESRAAEEYAKSS